MKRFPMPPRKRPMPKGKRQGFNSTLHPVNSKTGGHRFPKRRDPAYCAWIRTLPCTVTFCQSWAVGDRVECAHVKSRGAGGEDRGNTVPLCRRHHREQHDLGIKTFQRVHDLDLAAIARRVWAYYCAANPGEAA